MRRTSAIPSARRPLQPDVIPYRHTPHIHIPAPTGHIATIRAAANHHRRPEQHPQTSRQPCHPCQPHQPHHHATTPPRHHATAPPRKCTNVSTVTNRKKHSASHNNAPSWAHSLLNQEKRPPTPAVAGVFSCAGAAQPPTPAYPAPDAMAPAPAHGYSFWLWLLAMAMAMAG